MRNVVLLSTIVGAGLLWSPMAWAAASDVIDMHNFEQSACMQDPAQVGCIGFQKNQPMVIQAPIKHHVVHTMHKKPAASHG